MKKKILKALTNNISYKLLALLFSLVLWGVVYGSDDPDKTVTFTSKVTVENADVVAENNQYYEILDNYNYVTFAVTGKRSIVENLQDSDFRATADMELMTMSEDGTQGTVPISITCSRYSGQIRISAKGKEMNVRLESLATKQFVVTAEAEGQVKEGYALGPVSVSTPNVLKVSGPESLVSTISEVVATIDVDDMNQNISDKVIPVLYDSQGEEIDTSKLDLSVGTISVSAVIYFKKEVTLSFETSGTPAGNNRISEIISDPDTIEIMGAASTVNQITAIDVPAEVLDVSGADADVTTTIDITAYLPENVYLVDDAAARVTVTVKIESFISRTLTIPTSRISLENLGEGLTGDMGVTSVSLKISGPVSEVESMKAEEIRGTVDCKDKEAGSYNLPVTWSLPESSCSASETTIYLTISSESDGASDSSADSETAASDETSDNASESQDVTERDE